MKKLTGKSIAEIERLKALLTKAYAPHLVCDEKTQLVIEGFPRSANSFTVDMITVLLERYSGVSIKIAHHTHSKNQILLAEELEIPTIILVREPVDAILSFAIYSETSIDSCITEYQRFYETVVSLKSPFFLAEFVRVIEDFNDIVAGANRLFGLRIPLSRDLENDIQEARWRAIVRSSQFHETKSLAVRRISQPNAEREKLKRNLRPMVVEKVARSQEIEDLYHRVVQIGSSIYPDCTS